MVFKMYLKIEDVELLVKRGLGGEDKVIEIFFVLVVVFKDEM